MFHQIEGLFLDCIKVVISQEYEVNTIPYNYSIFSVIGGIEPLHVYTC